MPESNPGSQNANQVVTRTRRRKQPKPKPAPQTRPATPTPDQQDRSRALRTSQLAHSKPLAGDAPQTRAADTARAQAYVRSRYEADRANHLIRSAGGRTVNYVPRTTVLPQTAQAAALLRATTARQTQQAARLAPVLSVLDQTTRPLHAIAGAADAAVQGRNVPHAALRGIENKDKTTFSNVLDHAGVHNHLIRAAAGFGLDVALDPTTYLTGGLAAPARSAALKAGQKAEAKALAAGLTEEQAKKFGERATAQALKTASPARGATVKFAGHEAPGVSRTTARAGATVQRGVEAVRPARAVRNAGRHLAADFNPNVVPDGIERGTYETIRGATRTARSTASREIYKVRQQAAAVNKAIGDDNYQAVLDAIESGKVGSLPAHLQTPAKLLRDRFKYARRIEKQAGIRGGTRSNYVPHVRADLAEEGKGVGSPSVGSRTVRPSSSRARSDTRTLAEIRQSDPEKYIEDPGVLYGARLSEGAVARSKADLNRRLADVGRDLPKGKTATLGHGEAAYLIRGSDIQKLEGRDLERALESRPTRTYSQGSRDATIGKAQQLRQRAKDIDAELQQIAHRRSRLMGAQGVRRGQEAAQGPLRAYYVGAKRFETRAEAEAERKASGGNIRVVARSRAEARRIGQVSQLERLGRARNHAKKAALAEAKKLEAEISNTNFTDRGGHVVALNEQAVDRALKTMSPGGDKSFVGEKFDQLQGTWKLLATQPNPGFHVRNFLGDLQNAYLGQNAGKLAVNVGHAGRALTELGRQEKALKTVDLVGSRIDPTGKGLKIGGQHMSYSQLISEAEKTGGVRSGFVSRELHDLIEGKVARQANGRFAAVKRWANNREDVIRLATYIGARQKGKTAEQAAAHVAAHHFDYSDLTEIERKVMRRVMPFYTFSARNIPLQFKALVANPGKYAQYEKIREETAKAFGLQDTPGDLSDSEQRSAPIRVRINGRPYTISLGPSGLPLTDLNEFPTAKNPLKQADEWINRAMSLLTPAVKTPVEMWSNFSFFFRDQIEKDDAPLVPVSSLVVKAIPGRYRKQLGFTPDYVDKRTGKKGWAAPAKVVYAMGVLPGPAGTLNRLTTHSDRVGQSTGNKVLGAFGPRVRPVDKRSTQIDVLYQQRADLDKKMRALNQQGVNADTATLEYAKLQEQERDLTGHIMALKTLRGDKILPGGASGVVVPDAPAPTRPAPGPSTTTPHVGIPPSVRRALHASKAGTHVEIPESVRRALHAIHTG